MDSAAYYRSKTAYFNICHGKNSKVTAVDKFQKYRVDTPLKYKNKNLFIHLTFSLSKQRIFIILGKFVFKNLERI